MGVSTATDKPKAGKAAVETFDVLIVGAGISGVGGAYHLKTQSPGKSFVVLESLESFGGTWLTHDYPGTRSDSDLYTFGYRFKPWEGKPIATRAEILRYVGETIEENGLGSHIRYGHQILTAEWSTQDKLWTVVAQHGGERIVIRANFLWMCQGYYRHSEGYTPEWPGFSDYAGQVIHPQRWPKDTDLKGKDVLVIGSGAAAATLVPAIAGECNKVTMLQRSPTYYIAARNQNDLVEQLRQLEVDPVWIHEIARRKILYDQGILTQQCFEQPEMAKAMLVEGVKALLPQDYDMTHFTPTYLPWRQRIAFVPEGDLFASVKSGKADVVTDEIERFTKAGVLLKSGREMKADIIVTATGFNLSVMGDIAFTVDGKPLDFADTITYRGMMFTGAPNLVWVFGYFRASWTLRVDLVADFVIRLLKRMDATGAKQVEVALGPEDRDMEIRPWIDPENFNPGYIQRGMHLLPKSGDKPEWRHTQDYWTERNELPKIDLDDPVFVYS
jgi:cation diffusion facilitator CzcD-associated flavoprotein CzcO